MRSTRRFRTVWITVCMLALLVPTAGRSGPADPPLVTGIVRDVLGNVLAGVEVLVLAPADTATPMAVAQTGADGRFLLTGLPPGAYKLAALKEGYLTFLGGVDTALQDSVAVVLRPAIRAVADDPAAVPERSTWSLRVPRRGLLRDLGPDATGLRRERAERGIDEFAERTSVRIEQLFAAGDRPRERDGESNDLQASETRVSLASPLGDRGNFLVRGRRETLGAERSAEDLVSLARQRSEAMRMNLSLATSPEAQLAISAYYSQNDFAVGPDPTLASAQQERRTWGYDARWSTRIDEASHVAVQVDYRDTSVVQPPSHPGLAPLPAAALLDGGTDFQKRAVTAEGTYERTHADGHDVQVALRAQMLELPLTAAQMSAAAQVGSMADWSLQFQAQDTYSVSAPFALLYGLGYKETLVSGDARMIAPVLGGTWSDAGWRVSAAVSYHAVSGATTDASARWAEFRPARPVGYEASLEVPICDGLLLEGGTSYSPVQFHYFGSVRGPHERDGHPFYVTDGTASVEENHLALIEDRGRTRTFLELIDGRASGLLATLLPFDTVVPTLADRELTYRNASLGFRVPELGTDLLLEYQRVVAAAAEAHLETVQESVELQVRKDLGRASPAGDWRFLVAVRLGSVDSGAGPEGSRQRDATLEALNRRVSAGVSVAF